MPLTAPDDTVEIHGFALREYRELRGRKPAELADEVGVDRSYIARIELGHNRRVSRVLFNKLVNALDLRDYRSLLAHAPRRDDATHAAPASNTKVPA